MPDLSVIVAGAGPVGLLTTLRLAQAGIRTTCLEAQHEIESSPRAMAYHPVATRELGRAGLLDDIRKIGSAGRGVCWRETKNKSGEVIALIERHVTPDFPYENLVIGQHELAAIILEHVKRHDESTVLFDHKVTALDQSSGSDIKLTVERADGSTTQMSATYVVAADGGRSTLRRLLDISFDGFTYPEQLVSTNVYFPFDTHGWQDGNFCIDPEHWALIARINDKGLWRVSYGELDGLSHDQIVERQPWKFAQLFPGADPPEYKLDQMSPYRLNQRCAGTFRKGRVMLAGDAAHLCNPFGGLGLTGGILDAAALSTALIGIHEGKAGDAILDKYAEIRRNTFVETVNPTSQANKMRLHDKEPSTLGDRDPFLHMIRTASPDEKQKVRANYKLFVDMSEYYDKVDSPQHAATIVADASSGA